MDSLRHPAVTALVWLAVTSPLSAQIQSKPLEPANLDTTCSACQDFYRYANGGWLKRNSIPGDQPRWGSFNELQEQNYAALQGVLTEAARNASSTKDPNLKKLGTFYGSCMDSSTVEAAGIGPLRPELNRLDAIRDRQGVEAAIARLHGMGIPAGFVFHSTPDAKRSSRTIGEVYQGGLGLPDRDYYLKEDSASEKIRREYVSHISRMLQLSGVPRTTAASSAQSIMSLETALAQASMSKEQQRDPEAVYHLTSADELQKSTPGFSWTRYFSRQGLKGVSQVNVAQPAFVGAYDSLLTKAPLDTWKSYLRWNLIANTAPALGSPVVEESFRFNSTVLRGVKEMRPRWKRCLTLTDNAVGEILGQAYVKKNFTPQAKERALEMVRNIRSELRTRLGALAWMSSETKTKAYAKLDSIINKIGYPDKWRDYTKLEAKPGPFVTNVLLSQSFEIRRDLSKIGRPTDRTEWGMTAPTVNAYYNPPTNEITFPAGIMQPPFFDPRADELWRDGSGHRPRDYPRLRRPGPPVRCLREPERLVDRSGYQGIQPSSVSDRKAVRRLCGH